MLLSLALAPIGIVSVLMSENAERNLIDLSERSLLTLTSEAAEREQQEVSLGFGVIEALHTVVQREDCQEIMTGLVESNDGFSFASYIPPSGIVECSSAGRVVDFSALPQLPDRFVNPSRRLSINRNGQISQQSVILLSDPHFDETGEMLGLITLSIPHQALDPAADTLDVGRPFDLITFGRDGSIVTTESTFEAAEQLLPEGVPLETLFGEPVSIFAATSVAGNPQVYVKVPVIPGVMEALGIWPSDHELAANLQRGQGGWLIPSLMWGVSITVAILALNALVLGPVRKLRADMDRFATSRMLPEHEEQHLIPQELTEIQARFRALASGVIEDEAQREALLQQKTVLLKEVYHRVKNNLQLISSIMSMQLRKVEHDETRTVLKRLQDRVLGLAAVHQRLYQTERIDRIEISHLIDELASHAFGGLSEEPGGPKVTIRAEPLILPPDQALPVALLLSELFANAAKYAGGPGGTTPQISVDLTVATDGPVLLRVANTLDPDAPAKDGTHLGTTLIQAFTMQLNGTFTAETREDGRYVAELRFTPISATPQGLTDH